MSNGKEAKRSRLADTKGKEAESNCIMENRCPKQHAATACLIFQSMTVQHRRALATRRGLCLICLTHNERTKCDKGPAPKFKEHWRQEHWLMTQQCGPDSSASPPARLPQIKHVPGRQVYQCRLPLTLRAGEGEKSKSAIETLFDDKAEQTVIRSRTAVDRGLPSIRVSPTRVSVPGFKDETCDRIFFIDAFTINGKASDVFISAWGGHRRSRQGQPRRARTGTAANPLRPGDQAGPEGILPAARKD